MELKQLLTREEKGRIKKYLIAIYKSDNIPKDDKTFVSSEIILKLISLMEENKDFLKDKYRVKYPNDPNMRINQNVGQIFRFVNEMKIGDIVISPFN